MHIARTPSVQCACTAPRSSASHLFNMENDWARSSLHLNKYMIPAFAFCNFGKWRTFGGSGGVGSGTILMLPTIIKYINTNKHHHITQKHTERERDNLCRWRLVRHPHRTKFYWLLAHFKMDFFSDVWKIWSAGKWISMRKKHQLFIFFSQAVAILVNVVYHFFSLSPFMPGMEPWSLRILFRLVPTGD